RVHLALPETKTFLPGEPKAEARASVLLTIAADASPPDVASIQKVVAGAVEHLTEENVSVVMAPAAAPTGPITTSTRVGPFSVSRGSATMLKMTLALLLLLNVALAGVVVWLWSRRSRNEPTPPGAF